MSSAGTCPSCSTVLPAGAPPGALCLACSQAAVAGTVIMKAPSTERGIIGDFEIHEKLGAGGMGAVYKARQVSLDRVVALKVLPSQFADDPEFVGRFQREARIASSFHHDNLVSVYSYGSADGVNYIAMELVEGDNLHQLLRRRQLDLTEALGITAYVAKGLQCGWDAAQLVHRDIKPSNIYVSRDGRVKVGDLGLAKSLSSNTTGLTHTGTMMGTPHYMSPEQCRGSKDIDFRADIYSLGCMLFEMLTGRPPYPGNDPAAVVHKHLHGPPPALLKELPTCPMPLALLVGRMLKKARTERHASYGELIAEIEALYHTLESGAPLDASQFRRPVQRRTPAAAVSEGMPDWIYWAVGALILTAIPVLFLPKPGTKLAELARKAATPSTPRPDRSQALQSTDSTPFATQAPSSDGWQNLLVGLDPKRDSFWKPWRLEGGLLKGPLGPVDHSRRGHETIAFPMRDVPANYDLRYRIRRDIAGFAIKFFFLQGGGGAVLDFDGLSTGNVTIRGLGRLTNIDRGTTRWFAEGELHEVGIQVREGGVTALMNGQEVASTRGRATQSGQFTPDANPAELNRAPFLGLNYCAGEITVFAAELRPVDEAGNSIRPAVAAPLSAAFGPWQPFFTDAEWGEVVPGRREVIDRRLYLRDYASLKDQPSPDGAIRARIQYQQAAKIVGFFARSSSDGRYKAELTSDRSVVLSHFPAASTSPDATLGTYTLPKPLQPGNIVLLELRLEGDRFIVLVDGALAIDARDSRTPGPGKWGILANDGWFESVEMQTPLPESGRGILPTPSPVSSPVGTISE